MGMKRHAVGLAGLAVFLVSATTPSPSARFARGIVQIARAQQSHDPRAIARLTGITLRDPEKWLDEPDGTSREAKWRRPPNALGVSLVSMVDVPVSDEKEIASSTDIELTGRPCISIHTLEQAAGQRATYGGTALSMIILDAPQLTPLPYPLGKEYASLEIPGRQEGATQIVMHALSPGPRGCLDAISLQRTRPAP
jgi:hypothetical protein